MSVGPWVCVDCIPLHGLPGFKASCVVLGTACLQSIWPSDLNQMIPQAGKYQLGPMAKEGSCCPCYGRSATSKVPVPCFSGASATSAVPSLLPVACQSEEFVLSLFSAGSQSTLGWRHLASHFHQVAPVTVGTPDGTALPLGDVDDQANRPVGTGVNQTSTHQKLLLVLVPVGCG